MPAPEQAKSRQHQPKSRGGMFGSLRVRNYRKFASGQVVSLIGTWMQRVAQDWLVLELSGGNAVALGIAAALQFGPTLLLSLWAGMLADRYDKRRLLIVIQVGMGTCALVLGLLDVTGAVQLWHVYALCVVLGAFSAMDAPVRQSFVQEIVGREQLTNAAALNAMTFNLARIVGPAVAGLAITAIGTGWVFLANAASFVAVIGGLLAMNPAELMRAGRVPRRRGQLVEALRYVWRHPRLRLVMTLVFCVSTFGLNFYITLAEIARDVFHGQADVYGLLSTFIAVGTLTGATLAARRSARASGRPPRLRLLVGGALVFSLLEMIVGMVSHLGLFAALLIPTGAAALTFTTTANATVQLTTESSMRGRVMGLYMLVFLGGTPLGGPVMGWIAERFGGQAPLIAGGLVSLLAAGGCGMVLLRQRRTCS